MKKSTLVSLGFGMSVLLGHLSHAQGPRFCVQAFPPTADLAFFANRELGITNVTIHVNDDARNAYCLDEATLTGAADLWNSACPDEMYEEIPNFWVNWETPRPPVENPNSEAYRSTMEIEFLPQTPAPIEHVEGVGDIVIVARYQQDRNVIEVYGLCPVGVTANIPCFNDGKFNYINWETDWGREVLAHEIGHALGLDHDRQGDCAGGGLMATPTNASDPRRGVAFSYCQTVDKIINPESECWKDVPHEGHQNPCEPLTLQEEGELTPAQVRQEGGTFCERNPSACDGSAVLQFCELACVTTSDDYGPPTRTCSWSCFNNLLQGSYGLAPSMGLQSPEPESTISGTITLTGWVQDFSGTSGVEFAIDGVPVNVTNLQTHLYKPEACEPPYGFLHFACNRYSGFVGSFDTRQVGNGSHDLDLIGVDIYGWPTVITIPVVISNSCSDTTSPTVVIASPTGGTVSGSLYVTASASDAGGSGLQNVRFFVDNIQKATVEAPPYQFWWNTTNTTDGGHLLKARAIDGCLNETTSPNVSVMVANGGGGSNDPPHLWVDEPGSGQSVAGTTVRILGWATDDGGVLRTGGVTFKLDGAILPVSALTWYPRQDVCNAVPVGDPYCPNVGWWVNFDSTQIQNGPHSLVVTANDGTTTTSFQRNFVVNNVPNPAPALTVDWPTENQTVSGQVWLDGWAIDDDGITGMTYKLDNQPLTLSVGTTWHARSDVCSGSGTADPRCPNVGWRAAFNSALKSDGPHTLSVIATDGLGGTNVYVRHIVIANSPSGVTKTFVASEDTYSRKDSPSLNYGTLTHLSFRSTESGLTRYAYLKFNVNYIYGPVVSAKLSIHESYGRTIPVLRVWKVVDSSWQELGLTWNNAPYNATLESVVFNLAANQTHVIDVTDLVSGNGALSIAFSTSEDQYLFISSREEQVSAYKPTLSVVYQP